MTRRNGNAVWLLAGIGLAFILILVLLLASVHELPLSPAHLNILGHELTEEVQSPQVLYSTTISLQPGQVYQVTYDSNGIHIEQRSSQLIERLNLSNVDLSVNDVISAHLYDLYIPRCGNGCAHVKYYDVFTSTPQSGWVYFYAKLLNYWESLIVPMVFPGIRAPMKYGGLLRFGVSYGNSTVHSWVVSPTNLNGKFGDWHLYAINYNANGYTTYVDDLSTAIDTVSRPSTLAASIYSGNENVILGGDDASPNGYGWIAFLAYSTSSADIQRHILPSASRLFDPTFYNGSAYFELVKGTVGIPTGVVRVPAAQTWLWLVKGITSDNYLHVKYVSPDSVLRIKYNGMVYEFRIDGEPNPAGLIEDYKIDLASIFGTTVLPNATVELIYPSEKVRFYVPSGFQVVIEGSGWSETHEVPLSSSYVDFGLPSSGSYTVEVLGYQEQPRVHIETAGSTVRVTVTDEAGYAIPGAKVYIFDGSNLAATGYTNDLGIYEFNKTLLSSDQARIVVSALRNGTYYHLDKVVTLTRSIEIQPQPRQPVNQVAEATEGRHSSAGLVFIIVILLLAIGAVLLGRGKRRAYIIPLLLLLFFPLIASYAHAEQVYLQWRDTGYDLAPGYRHTISLHVSYTNYPFYHRAGEASVQAGPLKIELMPHSSFYGFDYDFNVYIGSDRVYHERIGAHGSGTHNIDRVVQVEVDCNGNAIVYYEGQQLGSFNVDRNIDILRSTADGGDVSVTATRLYNCNSNGNSGGSNNNDSTVPPNPPPGPSNTGHYLSSVENALGRAATAGLLVLVLGGAGLALLIGYRQAKRHRLLAILPLLLLFPLATYAHAETIHIKWQDPWHVQEISITNHPVGSDNPHGRYLANNVRFDREAWVSIARGIGFRDTRIRDFDGSYERLWFMQGAAWGSVNGYCWWMKIRLRTIPPSTLSITIENATRIGTSNMIAAFAVLSYHYPGPQPLSIDSSRLEVVTDTYPATLISMGGGRITSATIVACGEPHGRIHFIYKESTGFYWRTYEGDLVLPDAPTPSSNNGSNNGGSSGNNSGSTTTTPSNNNNSSNSSSNNNNGNSGSDNTSTQPIIDWSSFQEKLSNALGSLRGAIESPSHAMLLLVVVLLAAIVVILLLRG